MLIIWQRAIFIQLCDFRRAIRWATTLAKEVVCLSSSDQGVKKTHCKIWSWVKRRALMNRYWWPLQEAHGVAAVQLLCHGAVVFILPTFPFLPPKIISFSFLIIVLFCHFVHRCRVYGNQQVFLKKYCANLWDVGTVCRELQVNSGHGGQVAEGLLAVRRGVLIKPGISCQVGVGGGEGGQIKMYLERLKWRFSEITETYVLTDLCPTPIRGFTPRGCLRTMHLDVSNCYGSCT